MDKNEQNAFEWFSKSAENGNGVAQYWMAICYKYGIGTEKKTKKVHLNGF